MKNLEIEAKFINIDVAKIQKQLSNLGFLLVHHEYNMERATFICHDPKMSLRVRKEFGAITMTYKYTEVEHGALGTEEIEITVSDFEGAIAILKKAHNPIRVLYQQSKRELWRRGDIEVSIDEWPGTGKYIEIECSSQDMLESTAKDLGISYDTALFGRVGVVYEALGYDLEYINAIEHLSFENPPKKKSHKN